MATINGKNYVVQIVMKIHKTFITCISRFYRSVVMHIIMHIYSICCYKYASVLVEICAREKEKTNQKHKKAREG